MKCRRCKTEMLKGQALENTPTSSPDFIGDKGNEKGCTVSRNGPPKMIECWKCPKCGHSVK